jgi:hypothetical protein
MSMIVLPYLGSAAARRELSRPRPAASASAPVNGNGASDPLAGLQMRLTFRTMRVLSVIAEQPGLSNRKVSAGAGISDQGQISKLLTRLAGQGLAENTGKGQPAGLANAWRLTPRGKQLERAFRHEGTGPERSA